MAENTVEATLASRYVDGVTAGIERTRRAMQAQMQAMGAQASSFAQQAATSFGSASAAATGFLGSLRQTAMTGLALLRGLGAGFGLVAAAAVGALATLAGFVLAKLREASAITELKIAHEGLIQAVGWETDTYARLKQATDREIASKDLLANANRVLQSHIKLTSAQYVELTGNIHRMARAANVDGAQAHKALSEALIRGNTETLRSIGININVADAVSNLALATGRKTSEISNAAKMEVFYQQLLLQTRATVASLPPEFISVEDAIRRSTTAWNDWINSIAESVNRSGVLQELLRRFVGELSRMTQSTNDLEALTLTANRFFIDFLKGLASAMDTASLVSVAWDVIWSTIKLLVNATLAILSGMVSVAATVIGRFLELLSLIPGGTGRWARAAVDQLRIIRDASNELMRDAGNLAKSFDGVGNTAGKLNALAASTRTLAGEMEAYAGVVVRGAAGTGAHGTAAGSAAENQRKLNEQLKEFKRLRTELTKGLEPADITVVNQWRQTLAQINALTKISEEEKRQLRVLAGKKAAEDLMKIEFERLGKVEGLARIEAEMRAGVLKASLDAALKAKAPDVGTLPPNLGDDPAFRAQREAEIRRREEFQRIQEAIRASNDRHTPDWAKPLRELHVELLRLNKVGMDPFHQTMHAMKGSVIDFAGQAGSAFAAFFADMVSTQEGAGKKLLAAFIGMIGQMLMQMGVYLMKLGILEIVAASTKVGRMLGHSHAAGAKALAVGAVLAAVGGAMQGAASAMAQTNAAGAGGSFQQSVPRPTSNQQVQVIQVGAPGRAQNQGEAAPKQQPTTHEVVIKLDKGLIANEVGRNIRSNGPLRTVIQGATA